MNVISSVFKYKCPRCRVGDMFVKPLSVKDPLNMNKNCSHCNLKFDKELGYFYGAMFISYIFTAFGSLGLFALAYFVFGWSVNLSFAFIVILMIIGFVFIVRISRSIYIHLDTRYEEKYQKV